MRLSTIRIHPLKAGRGTELERVRVELWGLEGDRRWVAIGEDDEGLGGIGRPKLFGVAPTALPDGGLLLTAPGHANLTVPPPDPSTAPRVVAGRLGPVYVAGAAANGWISAVLGEPARLAWQADPKERPLPDGHGGRPGDIIGLAGDTPLLLTSQSSLDQVNDWMVADALERGEQPPEPMAMARFRPNVVVDGAPPFAEDGWKRLRIGELEFVFAEGCDRCAVTTYDPDTFDHGKEPLRTLSRHRKWDGLTWFGIRLIPEYAGTLTVGDPVEVIG